jgi:hypothetical protein
LRTREGFSSILTPSLLNAASPGRFQSLQVRGRLLEDSNYFYHYDCEGNLCFKEFKKPQGYSSLGKVAIEKQYGIKFKATATGWLYEWSAGGMLKRVVNPQQGKIRFGYDVLGRRM